MASSHHLEPDIKLCPRNHIHSLPWPSFLRPVLPGNSSGRLPHPHLLSLPPSFSSTTCFWKTVWANRSPLKTLLVLTGCENGPQLGLSLWARGSTGALGPVCLPGRPSSSSGGSDVHPGLTTTCWPRDDLQSPQSCTPSLSRSPALCHLLLNLAFTLPEWLLLTLKRSHENL